MARHNRIATLRILLAVALEDATTATTMFEQMLALGQARSARRDLRNLGVSA